MASESSNVWNPSEEVRCSASHGLSGRYTNYFSIGHNSLEFLIDFGEIYNGGNERMHSRIVMNPSYAKELLRILSDSIHSHEEQFGVIPGIGEETSERKLNKL